jgi:hypothetical protein
MEVDLRKYKYQYNVSNQQVVTGSNSNPAAISTISAYNTIGVSYTINSGPDDGLSIELLLSL